MTKPEVFTPEQYDILFSTLLEASQDKKRFRNQEQLALALELTQPSLSALLRRKWRPGITTARAIANLAGRSLEDLVGPVLDPEGTSSHSRFQNLDTCLTFYAGTRTWSPWTVAAAKAGYFGEIDLPAPEWATRLDLLEKVLDAGRRAKK